MTTANILKEQNIDEAFKYANSIIIINGLGETILGLYKEVALWRGRNVLREINESSKEIEQKAGFGFNEEWVRLILEYFRLYLLNKAVLPISNTTRKSITDILERGQREGWGIDRMVFELELVNMPLSRARTIVRTEVLKASFYGTELGKRESKFVTEEVWIASHDHRTRHAHRLTDGKKKKEGGKFKVPVYRGKIRIGYDMMDGPGDPTASAANIINCRCTRSVRAKRDSRGRLIRRENGINKLAISLQ